MSVPNLHDRWLEKLQLAVAGSNQFASEYPDYVDKNPRTKLVTPTTHSLSATM